MTSAGPSLAFPYAPPPTSGERENWSSSIDYTSDILKAADWSSETVFTKFYYKPLRSGAFGEAVLSNRATTTTVDTYVRLSLLKYNYRMAQST